MRCHFGLPCISMILDIDGDDPSNWDTFRGFPKRNSCG
jgi:hypothetical protein